MQKGQKEKSFKWGRLQKGVDLHKKHGLQPGTNNVLPVSDFSIYNKCTGQEWLYKHFNNIRD